MKIVKITNRVLISLIVLVLPCSSFSANDGVGVTYGSEEFGLFFYHIPIRSKIGYSWRVGGAFTSENYGLGGSTSVCSDGSLSGSTGSGTCSWHGGYSHDIESVYSMSSLAGGMSIKMTKRLKTFGHVSWATYIEDINVGNQASQIVRYGYELGVGYDVLPTLTILGIYISQTSNLQLGAALTF